MLLIPMIHQIARLPTIMTHQIARIRLPTITIQIRHPPTITTHQINRDRVTTIITMDLMYSETPSSWVKTKAVHPIMIRPVMAPTITIKPTTTEDTMEPQIHT